MASRRSRDRPLSPEVITEAALSIVDREGFAALTMRRLAAELGVDPMAPYYHIPTKSDLVRLMARRVFSPLATISLPADWAQAVRDWAHTFRDAALAHPNLLAHVITDVESVGAAALTANERLYEALESAGFEPSDIVHAVALIADFISGYVLGEAAAVNSPQSSDLAFEDAAGAVPDEFPVQRRVLAAAGDFDSSRYFDQAIETIITGLRARASTSTRA